MKNSKIITSKERKKVFICILFIFMLRLQEIMLRIVFPVPEVINFNRINYSSIIHIPEQDNPIYLSNAAFSWTSEPDGVEFIIDLNLYGFRDKTWTIDHKAKYSRVMFIGDSFVEGFMANDEETIPKGFEKRACANNRTLETLNLGVGASQLPQYYMLIRDAVPLLEPDYLILVFYANDFFNLPPFDASWLSPSLISKYSHPLKPRLYYIIENLIAWKSIPRIWRNNPFPFIASMPDPRNPWSSPEAADHYKEFVTPQIADAMKKGSFNPYVVNKNEREKKFLCMPFDILPHLTGLSTFLDSFSCKLLITYIPSNNQVSDAYLSFQNKYNLTNPTSLMEDQYQIHARILENTCSQLNIPFLDLTPILRKYEEKNERLYWNYDSHMKGRGYLLVGENLYEWYDSLL